MIESKVALQRLEGDVLEELARATVTRSSVVLAEELYTRGRMGRYGDPFGLVLWTLEELNEKGLITYRVGHGNVPVDLRVTQNGYAAIGYTTFRRPVGGRSGFWKDQHDESRREGDATDYRNHREEAIGGPIEAMSLDEHVVIYRDHAAIHADQIRETYLMRTHQGQGGGGSPRLSAAAREAIVARAQAGASHIAIGQEFGVTAQAVGYHVKRAGGTNPDQPGLRHAILEAVALHGPLDSRTLVNDYLGNYRAAGLHSVNHVLYSLEKQNLISMREEKTGSVKNLVRIEITPTGQTGLWAVVKSPTPAPEPETLTPQATETEPASIVDLEKWPVLAVLMARQAEQATSLARAAKYRQAAELLEDDETVTAMLVEQAEALEMIKLTEVEQEYIAYSQQKET